MTHTVAPFGWIAPDGGDTLMTGYDVIADLAVAIAAAIRPEICVLRGDVSTLLTHGAAGKVIGLDVTEVATTAAMADLANDRVVIQKPGYYRLDGHLGTVYEGVAAWYRVHCAVNGARVGRMGVLMTDGSYNAANVVKSHAYKWLNAGDLVTLVGSYQENGGTGATTTITYPGDPVNNEYVPTLSVALVPGAVPAALP